MTETALEDRENVIAEWSVHRIKQDCRKLITLVALVLLANALLFLLYRDLYSAFPFYIILGNLILLGSVVDYLFPIKFKLTSRGVESSNFISKKHLSWEKVRSCYISDEGIKLSPLVRKSLLDNFRGFVLLFNNNRDEVIEHVKRLAANRTR